MGARASPGHAVFHLMGIRAVLNSDGLGGIDMNRNWARNWERWHLQEGAGDFPMSEPETYTIAHFLNRHRNVFALR